jgi:hypothetical protein
LAIIILHAITGVCTPACLLAASISVEAVTPPLVGLAFKELLLFSRLSDAKSNADCFAAIGSQALQVFNCFIVDV